MVSVFFKVRCVNGKSAVQKHIIGLFSYLLGQNFIAKKFGSDLVFVFLNVRCVNVKSAVQKHIIGFFLHLLGQKSHLNPIQP